MNTKSFCNIQRFVLNNPNTNADIGELSTYAETYSKDIGVYMDPDYPEYTINNFSAKNIDGVKVMISSTLATVMIKLVNIVVQNAADNPGENFTHTVNALMIDKAAEYGIFNVAVGPMVMWDNHSVCSWFSFSSTEIGDDNVHKIWLDLDSFLRQYPEYELVMVPPVAVLDTFFQAPALVRQMISSITIAGIMGKAQITRGKSPDTTTHADMYDYVDPTNPAIRTPVPWVMLIYGAAGSNSDLIRATLIDYILTNSTHSRADWTVIFPDIFKATEFIIAPFWQKIAMPARALTHGVFSPIVAPSEVKPHLAYACPGYTATHIESNMLVVSHVFRSLQLAVCGGMDNRNTHFKISDLFPDYITVPTTSTDFNRMGQKTQNFALLLTELLNIADLYDDNYDIPLGTTKTTRAGLTYLVRSIDNVQYLVLAKVSAPPP